MTKTNTNILMILAVMLGLMLSLVSTAHSEPIDGGAKEAAELVSNDLGVADELAEPEAVEAPESDVLAVEAVNPAQASQTGVAKDVYDALKAGKYLVAFGGILMFLVWFI